MRLFKGSINGEIIGDSIKVADNFLERLVGLLAHKSLNDGEGLLINKCKQVHTFGMKFNIDVIFLSIDGEVLHIEKNMPKNKTSKYIGRANCVLELKAGIANKYNIKKEEFIMFKAN